MSHTEAAPGSSLTARRRSRELAEAADGRVADVLVVGLGATGAGAALDAAARGLNVVAVDAHDLAFGTSRWSSKLIHGGLRYLASAQFDVAHESAVERGVLMTRTAPHLVAAEPFVLPLTPFVSRAQASLAWAGFRAGDVLRLAARTPRQVLPAPRRLSATEARHLTPAIRAAGLRGGLLSWDGKVTDDARLVTALARTAAARGARVLTRVRVLELTGTGARVRDDLTGEEGEIRARAVINATGVWAGELVDGIRIRPSRGTHLVLRSERLGALPAGLHIPVPGETNRFVLVLPQGDGRVYVGLTDEPVEGAIPDVPEVPETDIGFLLDVLGSVLDTPVARDEVVGAFAGLRPLLDTSGHDGRDGTPTRTSDISRRHAVLTSPDGVTTVVGGKLTTYRRMAQDAVDAAAGARGLRAAPSPTATLPLIGAAAVDRLRALPAPRRLVRRYGTEAAAVHTLAAQDPSLAAPVLPGHPVTRAELLWAVRHEGALDESDLLDRRTRIGLVPQDRTEVLALAREVLEREATTARP
ncbi:glycerol-3-phosphate dehydrogenase/oxidase [Streptomyces pluripotens]|uniref:Glycerol-3-phosphate dehydrogenase/oxidase n=1 Tax=Streptomyces pluripotens TaxID=1355015 RepID=A0A221NSE7_9ACTN|nr:MULTISPECIES: glycerol-3-phosphate dehydrogenase/oxidase [Streptomyces]ARP68665.1 glycerol-3-phosphate dehydrogenase [Streptomyces pluripotens]ASN22923.1 glycerol-3-phosphate dehydrogenase/oxidase [Streptomyces pluripotens]KIE26706.1 glycerol-3-phosphate dehydrogenase [Streptomyces sp. MUSC 125]MCH0559241.1 glycerol-3-phosphate dehydrogenase/oxidase [Streptomyces sp. MUM 16J]